MAPENWVKRIVIGDRVKVNDKVSPPDEEAKIRKQWEEQQHIDLSIQQATDAEIIQFLTKGKL